MDQVASIRIDKCVMTAQIRCKISNKYVDEIAQSMADGQEFDPIDVFLNAEGMFIVADGAHRLLARQKREQTNVKAWIRECKPEEASSYALELSMERNCRHGLRMSTADKRNAIMMALLDDRLKRLGDKPIAVKVGVSPGMVKSVRAEMHAPASDKDVEVTSHRRRRPDASDTPAEPEVDSHQERIRTIRDWVQAGVLEWPDIRAILTTDQVIPTLLPVAPCNVVLRRGDKQVKNTATKIEVGVFKDERIIAITLE